MKQIFLVLFTSVLSHLSQAQSLAINTTGASANSSSILDVSSTTKGMLIPRLALTARSSSSPVSTPATSLIVYNTATAGIWPDYVYPGFYFWDGAQWERLLTDNHDAWKIRGNSGTDDTVDFLGTTDAKNFNIKTNNFPAMFFNAQSNFVGIGDENPGDNLVVKLNTRAVVPVPAGYAGIQVKPTFASGNVNNVGLHIGLDNVNNTEARIMNFGSGDLLMGTNNYDAIRISAFSSFVGIGLQVPQDNLTIRLNPKGIIGTPDPYSGILMLPPASGAYGNNHGLHIGLDNPTMTTARVMNNESGDLVIGTNKTEMVYLKPNTRFVGVNTNLPYHTLTVNVGANGVFSLPYDGLGIIAPGNASNSNSGLVVGTDPTSINNKGIWNYDPGKIAIATNNAERVTITSAGDVGINTLTPQAKLHLDNGNVVFTMNGTAGTSYIAPVSGAGRRMLWYADLGAFRAGYVDGSQWDASNTGAYSFASGYNTIAQGSYSTSIGISNIASATASFASGFGNNVSGIYSSAIGYSSTVQTNNSMSLGNSNQVNTPATGGFAIGTNNTVVGGNGFAIGNNNSTQGTNALSFGNNVIALGAYSTAMGYYSQATGQYSFTLGDNNTASATSSTAMGSNNTSSGNYSTSMGASNHALGHYSLASGKDNFATGDYSMVTGRQSTAGGFYSFASGYLCAANGSGSIAGGVSSFTSSDYAVAFGLGNNASGVGSMVSGQYSTAGGNNAQSSGNYAAASGNNSIAAGDHVTTNADGGVAFGMYNEGSDPSAPGVIGATDRLFQLGNGTGLASLSNAVTVLRNGNTGIGTSTPAYRLDLANGSFGFGNSDMRTETRNDAGLQGNAGAQSGYFETNAPVNYPSGASSWWHLIDSRHSNTTNNYAMQIAGSFFDQELWFRKTNNSASTAWTRLLSTGNLNNYGWSTTGNSGMNAANNFIGTTTAIDFVTRTNNTEKMRVTSGGYVGIGTASPANRLDILGIDGWDLSGTEGDMRIGNGTYRMKFGVALSGGGAGAASIMQYGVTGAYNALQLGSQGNTVMYIMGNTANVGIGTNAPTQKLHVIGNILASGTITPSDIRYKKNIQLIQSPVEKLNRIRGVSYNLKTDEFPNMGFTDANQMGFIAQEVEKVFPELVVTDKNGYKAVDYPKITPVLVEAIKDQQKQINDQQQQINSMKQKMEMMEKKIMGGKN